MMISDLSILFGTLSCPLSNTLIISNLPSTTLSNTLSNNLTFMVSLFSILVICVIVIDISGFVHSIKVAIGKYLKISPNSFRIKPFDCSFCMTFWVSMIYLLVVGRFTLVNIAIVLLLCCLTTPLKNLIMSVRDKLTKWMDF